MWIEQCGLGIDCSCTAEGFGSHPAAPTAASAPPSPGPSSLSTEEKVALYRHLFRGIPFFLQTAEGRLSDGVSQRLPRRLILGSRSCSLQSRRRPAIPWVAHSQRSPADSVEVIAGSDPFVGGMRGVSCKGPYLLQAGFWQADESSRDRHKSRCGLRTPTAYRCCAVNSVPWVRRNGEASWHFEAFLE